VIPDHQYVCCDGPNVNCYGHAHNDYDAGDPIDRETNPTGSCEMQDVSDDLKDKKCNAPVSPCNANTGNWNCRHWANWDGNPNACPDTSPLPLAP
jgi:hypothetical protein